MTGEKSDAGVYLFAFGLAVFASTLLVVADGACDEEGIKKCESVSADDHPPKVTFTRDELEAICRQSDEFIRCRNTSGCARYVQESVMMNDYMCVQHKEDLLEHAQCLSSKNVRSSVKFCGKNLETEYSPRPTPCDYILPSQSLWLSCFVRSVDVCCGKKASAVMDDLFRYYVTVFGPSSNPDNCQLRSDLDVKIFPGCSGSIKLVQYFGTTLLAIITLGLIRKDWLC